MNLLKLTIANGPSMGGSLYLNKDKYSRNGYSRS